jgi:hypothetical protein
MEVRVGIRIGIKIGIGIGIRMGVPESNSVKSVEG